MSALGTAKSAVDTARDRNVTLLAAGVTYYAFVSIIPLLILALAVASTFGEQQLIDSALQRIRAVTPAMASLLERTVASQAGHLGASLVGTLTLIWSAIRVFRGIDLAFGEIYEMASDDGLVEQVKKALIVVAVVAVAGALIAVAAAAASVISNFGVPFADLVSRLLLVAGLALLFLPIYYVLPPIDVTVGHALPGAIFASVGWVVLQWAFIYYTGNAGQYQAYGVLGGVLLFVTWLYAASILLLAGAVLNLVRRYPGGNVPTTEVVTSD